MNRKTALLLGVLLSVLFHRPLYAQTVLRVEGLVADSAKVGIPSANVRLIAGKDTLSGSTDSAGRFAFTGIRVTAISLLVRSISYSPFTKNYTLSRGNAVFALPVIMLAAVSKQLDEVVIKAKVIPVRLMKDTMEFNASAYTVRENDNVDDLLKQLPGVEVDKDGNVTAAGQAMTKLRVNGKDFFTGNVKEFISRLPAGIVDKLQVIDDYGDKANFTGIKNGEPQKMLNLVLKDKTNRGTFGNASASAGTNDRYSAGLNGNIWRDTRQIGLNGITNNINNGAGINTSSTLGFNYRDKLGKKMVLSGNYTYGRNKTELSQQSHIQTFNTLGTIENESATTSLSKGNTHNFDLNVQSNDEDDFITGDIRGSVGKAATSSIVSSMQTGIIHQDLINGSSGHDNSPNVNGDFTIGHKFNKPGRLLSMSVSGGSTLNSNNQDQNNQIRYYDQDTGLPVKDSLRIQSLATHNRSNNLNLNLTWSEPLGNPADSAVKQNLDFTYLYTISHTINSLQTAVNDGLGTLQRVDSLSNQYRSSFITHTVGVNYRNVSKAFNYTLGVNAQPNLLTGAYEGRDDRIRRSGFNLSPVLRINYTPSPKNVFSLFYNGTNVLPNFNQLQPVPDTRNLQNVIIGNPQLKAAFNHSLNLSYRRANRNNGSTLQLMIRGTAVQNQVVSNTVLIRDTLNSLRQETRYLNTSEYYNFGSNYYWSVPFSKKKYNLDIKGGMNFSHQVSFSDNLQNLGRGLNLNQAVSIRMNQNWLLVNGAVSWNYRSNVYSLTGSNSNRVQTWLASLDTKTFFLKSFSGGFNASKAVNQGYSLPGSNPLLIAAFLEKTFFADRRAGVKLEGSDLLNQGNSLSRTVSDNSITESRSNQVTRYFLLTVHWKLQQFPGMKGFKTRRQGSKI